MATRSKTELNPVLKSGVIYMSDNGKLICSECAGMTAKYTGRDISGQRVLELTPTMAREIERDIDRTVTCEAGCTSMAESGGKAGA